MQTAAAPNAAALVRLVPSFAMETLHKPTILFLPFSGRCYNGLGRGPLEAIHPELQYYPAKPKYHTSVHLSRFLFYRSLSSITVAGANLGSYFTAACSAKYPQHGSGPAGPPGALQCPG